MRDLIGEPYTGRPAYQPMLFRQDDDDDKSRVGRFSRAILRRENGEDAFGQIERIPQGGHVKFMSARGQTYCLPMKHLVIHGAGDLLVIAIKESAMSEQCELYGLWESSYFVSMRR